MKRSGEVEKIMFDPVMMVMQPRFIWESLASLKKNIDIPTAYFRAYTEPQVIKEMNKFINETSYSHYIVMSDDGVVSRKAADTILKYMQDDRLDIFTGWMNMHLEKDGNYSKISTIPAFPLGEVVPHGEPILVPPANLGLGPVWSEYPPWAPISWVMEQKGLIKTNYANFAMSGARREIFLEHPLGIYPSETASDHHWSYRLQQAGLQVYTHTDAFIKHLRQGWFPWKHNWLVGQEPAKIIYPEKPNNV